jgi:hypothetical protein
MQKALMIAQALLLLWILVLTPQCSGGPGYREREVDVMRMTEEIKEGIEQYHDRHRSYPGSLSGIVDPSYLNNVAYLPVEGKEGMYELLVRVEDSDEEYYAYTGDPLLYLRSVSRKPWAAPSALLVLSVYSLALIYRSRRPPAAGEKRYATFSKLSAVISTALILVAMYALFYPPEGYRQVNPLAMGFTRMRNDITAAVAYRADHGRYPRTAQELTGGNGLRGWFPYGYAYEYGTVEGKQDVFAVRVVRRDGDMVYEMYTDRPGVHYRKKHETDGL